MTPAQTKLLADLRSGAVLAIDDERQAFEAWVKTTPHARCDLSRGNDAVFGKGYLSAKTSLAWDAWKARAMASPDLSASLAEMIEGLVERDEATWVPRVEAVRAVASDMAEYLTGKRPTEEVTAKAGQFLWNCIDKGALSPLAAAHPPSETRVSALQAEVERLTELHRHDRQKLDAARRRAEAAEARALSQETPDGNQ